MTTLYQLLERRIDMNGFVGMPILSHIEGNLYVGMSPCYWPTPPTMFRTIFNLYVWNDYPVVVGQTRYDIEMRDSENVADISVLRRYAVKINEAQEIGPVLVHCQMGINRSNLLAAFALILKGRTAKEAIQLLRDKRSPYVLMNRAFELFLLKLGDI